MAWPLLDTNVSYKWTLRISQARKEREKPGFFGTLSLIYTTSTIGYGDGDSGDGGYGDDNIMDATASITCFGRDSRVLKRGFYVSLIR